MKTLDLFHKRTTRGHELSCKECRSKRKAEWYQENIEAQRKKGRDRYHANPEKFKKYHGEWVSKNRERAREINRRWLADENNRAERNRRRKNYEFRKGIKENNELWVKQGGKCAICKVEFSSLPAGRIHLDHCHTSGRIRGWLCLPCNTALGMFRDDPNRIRRAAEYIEESNGTS